MKQPMRILALFVSMVLALLIARPAPVLAAPDQQPSQAQLAAEHKKKPWYKSRTAKIVGGSAGAGAVVGALVGGGKGAAAGALVGGGGGYLYDRKTRKK